MSAQGRNIPVPTLPVDVLENIFQNLDGKTFSQCRQVCKTWQKFIDTMTVHRKNVIWCKICMQNISRNVLLDLLYSKNITSAKKTLIDWSSIYQKWFAGRWVKSKVNDHAFWGECKDTVILCTKVSGTNIITGHSQGVVCVWSMKQPGLIVQKAKCHLSQILDIALVDLHCLGSYHGMCDGIWSHHHMITVSKDTNIRVKCLIQPLNDDSSDIVLSKHGAATTNVRVFDDRFAVCSNDNTVTLWSMKMDSGTVNLQVTLLRYIRGPRDPITKIHLWEQRLVCISSSGNFQIYLEEHDLIDTEWQNTTLLTFDFNTERRFVSHPTGVHIFNCYYVFLLTTDGKLIVSTNDYNCRIFNLMQLVGTEVTSIDLKGNILALGGNNGRLFIYYFTDLTEAEFPDLSKPHVKVQLSPASITSLDIAFEPYRVVVAAATSESLFLVRCGKVFVH